MAYGTWQRKNFKARVPQTVVDLQISTPFFIPHLHTEMDEVGNRGSQQKDLQELSQH